MVSLWLIACGLPTTSISVDGHSVRVEIAATPEDRNDGLMHRKSLAADSGMLFVYPASEKLGFWMKNTTLPLSIAFADESGKIVRISDMVPLSTERVPSIFPAMYALEMNKGWFAEHDVVKGEFITDLPDIDPE